MAYYREKVGDVFEHITDETPLVHCISADYALGAGIAKTVEQRFKVKKSLIAWGTHKYPDCLKVGNVINLVTKEKYWNKPTYITFSNSLKLLYILCRQKNIETVVMPQIGCGLDRLDWNVCKQYIQDILVKNGISVQVWKYGSYTDDSEYEVEY